MTITLRATRRRSRLAPRLIWLLTILAALYSAAWFGAARLAQTYAGDWLEREAERGRVWGCADPAVSGFPFKARLTCGQPGLTIAGDSGTFALNAKSIEASVDALSPMRVNLLIEAPVTVKFRNGDTLVLKASHMEAKADLRFSEADKALQALRWTADAPDIAFAAASGRGFAGKAQIARLHLAAVAAEAGAGGGYALTADIEGAKAAALESLTQSAEAANAHISGVFDKVDLPGRGSLPAQLERWRAAGGALTLSASTFGNSVAMVEASGPLSLDGEHRPAGKLALKLKGAGPILQRVGIPANLLNAGNLLGALLGRGKKPDAELAPPGGADAGAIKLTLTLEAGRAMAGPLPLPVELRPLY